MLRVCDKNIFRNFDWKVRLLTDLFKDWAEPGYIRDSLFKTDVLTAFLVCLLNFHFYLSVYFSTTIHCSLSVFFIHSSANKQYKYGEYLSQRCSCLINCLIRRNE